MAGRVAELKRYLKENRDALAEHVASLWDKWNDQRQGKINEWKEVRNYVFATDTSTTSNKALPWKNSTTTPKLCQIRDNLHSNYISALFPNDNYFKWIGESEEDQAKARAIEGYMRDKAHQSQLRNIISQLVYDYIDYGNAFVTAEHVREVYTLPDGRTVVGYEGPRATRISPFDIVFNPIAPSFRDAPKIIRSIQSIGELELLAQTEEYWEKALSRAKELRDTVGGYNRDDFHKANGFSVDGFGNLQEYYGSGYVEILTFRGDYYDSETRTSYVNQKIVVIDRSIVVYEGPADSWLGHGDVIHVGWRLRPDNLWAMGPLDNLVGMQYRIDHLENLKADAMDLMVQPPLAIYGDVEPFNWAPGEVISIIGEGKVEELGKNFAGVVAANNEIAMLEAKMEEYAGAPKTAMGIRTPGEKTAFEVQSLDNAAGRIFQEKSVSFEIMLMEPLLNLMLALGRQKTVGAQSVRAIHPELGLEEFLTIQPEDLVATGTIRPIGARHFGEQARLIQNLSTLFQGPLGQMIMPHWSALHTAALIEDSMDLGRYRLVRPNVGLTEQAQQQEAANSLNQVVSERQMAGMGG